MRGTFRVGPTAPPAPAENGGIGRKNSLEQSARWDSYSSMKTNRFLQLVPLFSIAIAGGLLSAERAFVPLFSEDGVPKGWVVRAWNDVRNPAEGNPVWKIENGVLHGGEPRGSWLLSEKEYGDFELEFEFKLGPTGNSGCALRVPMFGDPAFDGMELQMADFRYNPEAKDSELTGGFYRAVAPKKQVYKPTEWNKYHV